MKWNALIAEFIGTFALIFVGAGAGALNAGGLVGVAFAHGFVVVAFVYAYGHISGTHINPAVTVGLWLCKKIETVTAIGYIIAQFVGGIVAAYALRYVLAGAATGLGQTELSFFVTPVQGLLVEAILTFFLVNTILNTSGSHAGLAIGLTLTFCILMGGPLTGASVNPARTLGPAIASGKFGHLWLYFVGPIAGGAAAAFLHRGLLKK